MQGLFVTGTDTGVGKTAVAAGLTRMLRRAGVDAMTFKPVQTGSDSVPKNSPLQAPDVRFCLAAAELTPTEQELPLICPYRYKPACSPHLAGRLAGEYPDVERIADCAQALLENRDALIIEGAGGVMAPLNEEQTMLDLMARLGAPVLLVARGSLGTINHTLLSLAALNSAGVEVIGVVFNDPTAIEANFIRRDNPAAVAQFAKIDILGDIPHIPALASDADWEQFEAHFTGLDKILDALR